MLNPSDYSRPCVFFANGIGDHFMTLPTLRALGVLFPNQITLITAKNQFTPYFFKEVPIARYVEIDLWDDESDERRLDIDTILDAGDFDLFIHLCPWDSPDFTALLAKMAPKASIGFFPAHFEYTVPASGTLHFHEHVFELVRLLAPQFELDDYSQAPSLPSDQGDLVQVMQARLSFLGKTLVVHNETEDTRKWDSGKLIEVFEFWAQHYPDWSIVLLGLNPMELPETLSDNVVQINNLPLPMACAVALMGDAYLGVDSSFIHLVKLTRKPAVGIFGKTKGFRIGFRYSNQVNLQDDYDAAKVPVADVIEALERVIPQDIEV